VTAINPPVDNERLWALPEGDDRVSDILDGLCLGSQPDVRPSASEYGVILKLGNRGCGYLHVHQAVTFII